MCNGTLKEIVIPRRYNYIGVFLTFGCNLKCSFCINNFEGKPKMQEKRHLSGREWAAALNRLKSRDDLPVSLQGGEPLLHPAFAEICNGLRPDLHIDVLTNLYHEKFVKTFEQISPERIKREAPYASIRVSYHPEQMELSLLIEKVLR